MEKRTEARRPPLLIGWMSRGRLFLDGLVSTRAHLRFTC